MRVCTSLSVQTLDTYLVGGVSPFSLFSDTFDFRVVEGYPETMATGWDSDVTCDPQLWNTNPESSQCRVCV